MGNIKIYFSKVNSANQRLRKLADNLESVQNEIKKGMNLDLEIVKKYDIEQRLGLCDKECGQIREQLRLLYSTVDREVRRYKNTERDLQNIGQ